MSIRLLIVADTEARAQDLASILAEDERLEILSASGAAHSLQSPARDARQEEAPEVVLAVALSPGQITPFTCPLVVLSDLPEAGSIAAAKVHAWLPLNSSYEELAAAIFAAVCDLAVLTSDQRRRLRPYRANKDTVAISGYIEELTARELQVLRLVADGLGNKQIAAQLGLSDHTAKFHVAQILAKLGAASRTEAVTIGIRRGLVPV